ncbi:MAG: hypothetical protein ABI581_09450 [Sediminibacterium sp.]
MQIEFEHFKTVIAGISYKKHGAITEREYEKYLTQHFSNSEKFWKFFITPATFRIPTPDYAGQDIASVRDGVAQEIRDIGSFHYSIFLNIVYAHQILEAKPLSTFEYFYIHLGITCDLIEEFLQRVYFLILDCKGETSPTAQNLSKAEFTNICSDWYDKNYNVLFEHYFSKGKRYPIEVPGRKHILNDYFEKSIFWKSYSKISNEIKTYRNTIVHHHKLAFPLDNKGNLYVPKYNKISKYKKWVEVEAATKDQIAIQNDFIQQSILMNDHLISFKSILQNLWENPIKDFHQLLYEEKNEKLLHKYNLGFTP